MLEAGKDNIFVAPGPGINWANIHEGASHGITRGIVHKPALHAQEARVAA